MTRIVVLAIQVLEAAGAAIRVGCAISYCGLPLHILVQATNGTDWNYIPFYLPLNSTAPFSLFEGPNVIAVAVSTLPWNLAITFDLQVSADYK